MKNKRGDLTIGMIIGIILLLVGFLILLFIYYQLNWQGIIDRDVCHQSVILRATSPSITQGYIPLKCKTQKICITSKFIGGDCEEFKNEKGITYERVDDSEQGLRKIEKVYADELLGCWAMMGEGKINLFSSFLASRYGTTLNGISPSCVICSRVAIDKSGFKTAKLSNVNVLRYMETHYVPNNNETYVQYMSGGASNSALSVRINPQNLPKVEQYDKDGNPLVEPLVELNDLNVVIDEKNPLPETAILFMQISGPPGHLEGFSNVLSDAGITLGTSAVLAPKTTFRALGAAVEAWPITLIGLIVGGAYQQGSIYLNRGFTASYCGDNIIGDQAMRGCSVVRTVDYNVKDIVQYCPNIESIP